jgi:hypothetical protein
MGTSANASTSPKQLVKRAITATEAATALKFAGSVKDGNQTVVLNVSSDVATGIGAGRLGLGKGKALVRTVGGVVYLNANAAFWTQESGQSAAQLFAGKWVSTAATSASGKSLAPFVDGGAFLKQVFNPNLQNSVFALAGSSRVNGKAVTVIAGHDKTGTTGGRLYVAKAGPPYILRLVITSKTSKGTITFSNYNKTVHAVAPAGAIDLDTAGQSSG